MNDHEKAIEEAFNFYLKTKTTAMDNRILLAPVDSKWMIDTYNQ
ncbi:MAG TPA: hypothetical protein VNB67_09845 [Nitrososphaeraceae archaeon]|nr:hypothetical protein [Nitrososphaeraceae archaeon]